MDPWCPVDPWTEDLEKTPSTIAAPQLDPPLAPITPAIPESSFFSPLPVAERNVQRSVAGGSGLKLRHIPGRRSGGPVACTGARAMGPPWERLCLQRTADPCSKRTDVSFRVACRQPITDPSEWAVSWQSQYHILDLSLGEGSVAQISGCRGSYGRAQVQKKYEVLRGTIVERRQDQCVHSGGPSCVDTTRMERLHRSRGRSRVRETPRLNRCAPRGDNDDDVAFDMEQRCTSAVSGAVGAWEWRA